MVSGQSIAITGAAGGIGRAIAEKCIAEGAKVAISDINADLVHKTGKEIGAASFVCNVAKEESVKAFIEGAEAINGQIDMFVSNAGVGFPDEPGGHAAGGSNKGWELSWQVNVMSSIYAGRSLIPNWLKRDGDVNGRFVIVASAAGLLAQIGTASYTTTKHAARAYAEYMAIMHKDDGIKVHCICPQYVQTNMTKGMEVVTKGPDKHILPSDVADTLFECMKNDEFLVLPHPIISDYYQAKVADHDRYISGMARRKLSMDTSHIPPLKET